MRLPGNMNHTHEYRQREEAPERGQVLVMFACFLTVLLLFVGLGIDLGFAYITQARLSKGVDAAALAAMNNYYQGTAQAINIGQATFDANFAPNTNNLSPGYVIGTPTPSITFSNAGPNVMVNVTASATNKTFFIGILPQLGLTTLGINASAQATRLPLIMTLVLDHSESMDPNCIAGGGCTYGGTYLPAAVSSFISDFDPNVDQAAVVSFGSTWTNNVPMTTDFQDQIPPAVNNMAWGGGTCSICGLTNAMLIENSVAVPAGQQVVKAVVFFTDGLANMIESTIACPTGVSAPCNFGGTLPGAGEPVYFYPTNLPADYNDQENGYYTCAAGACCPSPDTYQSFNGTPQLFTMDNIINDATNQCILVAQQMQQQGMYVFCIGLNAASNGDIPSADFLQTLANDQANPATYNPALPSGVALISGNGADLAQLFQLIAAQIQLRLTR